MYGPVGDRAKFLFGKDSATMARSRVNGGSVQAVKTLYEERILQGIVTSAPSQESTTGWTDTAIKEPLVRGLRIPADAVLFDPRVVRYGGAAKVDHLRESVLAAAQILGESPRRVLYIADTNDDITEAAEANRRLREEGVRSEIALAMVLNGMGLPSMWKKAREQAGLEHGRNYEEFPTSMDAVRNFVDSV